jgi:aminocarboxymuconate-semialdehyde decarboxylase
MNDKLHTCATGADPEVAGRVASSGGENRYRTIDMHCHVMVEEVEALVVDCPEKLGEPELLASNLGVDSARHNGDMMADLMPKLTDIDVRLIDMDAMGIEVQVLSPSPTQYYYWADQDLASELVRLQNEHIADICSSNPERFVGLGAVSLQHPTLAAQQLKHCVSELGLRGVEISSTVNGDEIADKRFAPFWRMAEELDIIVFLHPLGTSLGARVNQHYLANLVGLPIETTIALSHLIFGGVLDRFPGLKICAAHGGGYIGSCNSRLNHGWQVRPECKGAKRRPQEYLQQIFFDTVVFDAAELQRIIESVGVSQVVLGTDYPFDMGNHAPLALVDGVKDLTVEQRDAICGGNAAGLLGLDNRDVE